MSSNWEKRIDYCFKSENTKNLALSHSSYVNENRLSDIDSNERLEFLGDSVLELVVSYYIYEKFPDLTEGELTKLRASVVCESMLAKKARELSLSSELKLGKGEEQTGGRERDSILSDLFEAVIGAIYLDGGYDEAKKFILRQIIPEIEDMLSKFMFIDAKTYLQEQIQKFSKMPIIYKVIDEKGPDHEKRYIVTVAHENCILGKGEGRNKKEAEQNAATEAIEKIK